MTNRLAGHPVKELPAGTGRGPGPQQVSLHAPGRCPVPECNQPIDPSRLMCAADWYRVPKRFRDQVWATWESGRGVDSAEHRAIVALAIATSQDARVTP
jgi:hypothetical protein